MYTTDLLSACIGKRCICQCSMNFNTSEIERMFSRVNCNTIAKINHSVLKYAKNIHLLFLFINLVLLFRPMFQLRKAYSIYSESCVQTV